MEPPPDLNTHLPPRKRLLAGFRAAAVSAEPPSPPPLVSIADVEARLRGLMGSAANRSPEEILEAARSAALAAADVAAAARAVAAEKAAVAARAKAAARSAMEFLDGISRGGALRNGIHLKVKSRKKHVKVKLLYRPNVRVEENGAMGDAPRPRRRRDSDEEVARKLHRAMNSSPRISFTGPKRPRSAGAGRDGCPSEDGSLACNGSSAHEPVDGIGFANGYSEEKSGDGTVQFSKINGIDDGEDSSWKPAKSKAIDDGEDSFWNRAKSKGIDDGEDSFRHTAKSKVVDDGQDSFRNSAKSKAINDGGNSFRNSAKFKDIADNGVGVGNLSAGRKVKIKRKQLFLNQHSSKETKASTEAEYPADIIAYDEPKSNGAEKRVSPADATPKVPANGSSPIKITSVWKFKKYKPSHCSSDSKMLHNVCSSASAAETSASVKAD